MTIQTTIGKTYAVTPQTECTISTTDGILIATCAAGEQTLFVAPGAEVEVSDDAALVTESFKGAPAGLSAVRGSIKKVSASLASKLNVSTFNAHKADATVHVTSQEREKWNGKQDNLTDASGNMRLSGGLTASGAINANGGVNIPLAVGAPTDTAAVNRLYAAGLAGVTNIYTFQYFLDTTKIETTGNVQNIVYVPFQYARTNVFANSHSTIVCPFTGLSGQWNYSSFAGFVIPWQLTSAGKLTVGLGRGSKMIRKDLTLDSYTIIPANDLAYNTGEILDITFDNVRDTERGGYVIRVREIYADYHTKNWKVKTTTSFIPASQNEPIPWIVNKVIYQQFAPAPFESEDAYGSLYLLMGGGNNQTLWKIAEVRGISTFEVTSGFNKIVTDLPGIPNGLTSVLIGAAERINYQPGNINPVYYALEALAGNAIEVEETADFEDINIPIE